MHTMYGGRTVGFLQTFFQALRIALSGKLPVTPEAVFAALRADDSLEVIELDARGEIDYEVECAVRLKSRLVTDITYVRSRSHGRVHESIGCAMVSRHGVVGLYFTDGVVAIPGSADPVPETPMNKASFFAAREVLAAVKAALPQ